MKMTGAKETAKALRKTADNRSGKGPDYLRQGVALALQHVKKRASFKLTTGPLHVRTGRLRGSLLTDTQRLGTTVKGQVGTDVVYGRVHEYGATIVPKASDYLRFQVRKGVWRSAKKVTIPARPWLGPSMKESWPDVKREIHRALERCHRVK